MSDVQRATGVPEIERQEHRRVNDVPAKAVAPYGLYSGASGASLSLIPVAVDSNGFVFMANPASLVISNPSLTITTAPTLTVFQATLPLPVSGNFAANIPAGSTVAAQQLGAPWSVVQGAGSTLTAYQGGSPWLTNASIIGVPSVNASIQGTPNVSVSNFPASQTVVPGAGSTLTAYQGGAPWLTNASIIGTPTVLQGSAPWTVNASIQGTAAISGNVSLTGGVSLVGTPTANVSIQGTVPISGSFNLAAGSTVSANQIGTWNVSLTGAVSLAGTPSFLPASGATLTAYQGSAPWTANVSVAGIPNVNLSSVTPLTASGSVQLLNDAVTLDVGGYGAAGIQITGGIFTPLGMIVFEGNLDGTNWQSLQAWPTAGGAVVTSSPANGAWTIPVGGLKQIRARVSTALTGAATVNLRGSAAGVPVVSSITTNLAAGATVSANQIGTWNVSLTGAVSLAGTPSFLPATGATLTAYQGSAPWTVNASIQGGIPVTLTGAVSLAGTPVVSFASGSTLTAYQGTNPWLTNASIVGTPNFALAAGATINAYQAGTWGVNVSLLQNATLSAFQGGAWNVGASTVYAQMANASASWTNANATNTALTLNPINGYGTILASFTGASITGGTLNFEVFDGASWWPLPMLRSNSYITETTYPLSAASPQVWQADSAGFQQARIRVNPAITGASLGTANLQLVADAAPNMTNMVVGQPTASNLQTTTTLSGAVTVNALNVSLTGAVSLAGIPAVSQSGTWAVNVSLLQNATLTAFQGGAPWLANVSQSGTWTVSGNVSLTGAVSLAGTPTFLPAAGATETVYQGGVWAANVSLLAPATVTLSGGVIAMVAADTRATGTSIYYNPTLTNTKVAVKASAANLYGYHVYNPNTTIAYMQLFNAGVSNVTIGFTVPSQVLSIPAQGWLDDNPGTPMAFGTAITAAMSAAPQSNLTLASLNVLTNLYYI